MLKDVYNVELVDRSFGSCGYNAAKKPRLDSSKTLLDNMGHLIPIYVLSDASKNRLFNGIIRRVNILFSIYGFYRKCLKIKDSIVFMQYPFLQLSPYGRFFLLKHLKSNGNKIIYLVHDLDSVRYNKLKMLHVEQKELLLADICIVHSFPMLIHLNQLGISVKHSVILKFFDYRLQYSFPKQRDLRDIKLVFAGNLEKSHFLRQLDRVDWDKNVYLFLYGSWSDNVVINDRIFYKGKFSPNNIEEVEGNWGLVWDGESINTCVGLYGNYLKINAPFKMSMYLAANLPVIVWGKSAMAEYVKLYNIGICIDSLNEIPNKIMSLTDMQINEIKHNVKCISEKIRCGGMLSEALGESIYILNHD